MSENQFVLEAKRRMAMAKAREMRYRKPMLSSIGWYEISEGLNDIETACSEVHWFFDDEKNLVSAFDGNDDEAWEFRMVFSDIETNADRLRCSLDEIIREMYDDSEDDIEDYFNTCTVALLGNRYEVLGFDTYQEDYYSLTRYEMNLATTEAGKKLMRKTKAEIISSIGHCMSIVLAYSDLKTQYDNISSALDILRGTNQGILDTIQKINDAYDKANDEWEDQKEYNKLLHSLPDEVWIC